MCDNLKTDRVRCGVCKTINLAKPLRQEKPDMQMYEKCTPTARIDCSRITELPLNPTCIKVCTQHEFQNRHQKPKAIPKVYYQHGKLMWGVKAGVLASVLYFTYDQGVWGDQRQVEECLSRWKEYGRSINSRRPPVYDSCGRVQPTDIDSSLLAPAFMVYKEVITTCFAGVVKVPQLIKCAYVDYLETLERKHKELLKERYLKRNSPK